MAAAEGAADDDVERIAGDEQRRVQGAMERLMSQEMAAGAAEHGSDERASNGADPAAPRGETERSEAHDDVARNGTGEPVLDSVHPAAINALRAFLAGSDWRGEMDKFAALRAKYFADTDHGSFEHVHFAIYGEFRAMMEAIVENRLLYEFGVSRADYEAMQSGDAAAVEDPEVAEELRRLAESCAPYLEFRSFAALMRSWPVPSEGGPSQASPSSSTLSPPPAPTVPPPRPGARVWVLWDIENVRLRSGSVGALEGTALRNWLRATGLGADGVSVRTHAFYAPRGGSGANRLATTPLTNGQLRTLTRTLQVRFINVGIAKPEQADKAMRAYVEELIRDFGGPHAPPRSLYAVIISGDTDFAADIARLREGGFQALLVRSAAPALPQGSDALAGSTDLCFSWEHHVLPCADAGADAAAEAKPGTDAAAAEEKSKAADPHRSRRGPLRFGCCDEWNGTHGWIRTTDGVHGEAAERVFVHCTAIRQPGGLRVSVRRLQEGEPVQFKLGRVRGRQCAVGVTGPNGAPVLAARAAVSERDRAAAKAGNEREGSATDSVP